MTESTETEFTQKELSAGKSIFAKNCDFIYGATSLSHLPDDVLPEIAFAGRSNVGKSSLINALTGRKALARTSQTPGRTQQINFFNLDNQLLLVDLPGYGYAKASRAKIKTWNKFVNSYLKGRASLRRVFILIDSRHGLKPVDIETMEMLDEAAVSYQIVLTKSDKEKEPEKQLQNLAFNKHAALIPKIITTSSLKKNGINELQALIAKITTT
ncbi:MAG: YihA family ribosome biogenesis GTP-binding protein [Alphaproteobacteria bacterium CG11_big_fil_rev_8_21_14_0_20_44_7]|nr:MAG: YihA family ribosome biogenesis GTP-binding protein [Alphaproteobacteria bacterium CG11_big_fil_rev_8_21_14_0_20_44_7]